MGFLKKMKAKLEDLNGFLKEKFPPIGGRLESMLNKINLFSGLVLNILGNIYSFQWRT